MLMDAAGYPLWYRGVEIQEISGWVSPRSIAMEVERTTRSCLYNSSTLLTVFGVRGIKGSG